MTLIALCSAVLLAAHSSNQATVSAVFGSYAYWIARIGVQALLFFAMRAVLETYAKDQLGPLAITGLAMAISLPVFVLSITAIDLVLGFPEIGIGDADSAAQTRITATVQEVFFLADNHIALCLLLSLPRLFAVQSAKADQQPAKQTFLSTLEPPVKGPVIWLEAQEHYVRITTETESRMVLARFSDVVRELPDEDGMQVHRSHWIRSSAIERAEKEGQNLYLHLKGGSKVPVSRSFRQRVQQQIKLG